MERVEYGLNERFQIVLLLEDLDFLSQPACSWLLVCERSWDWYSFDRELRCPVGIVHWLVWAVGFWIVVLILNGAEISLSPHVLLLSALELQGLLTIYVPFGSMLELHLWLAVSVLLPFDLCGHQSCF